MSKTMSAAAAKANFADCVREAEAGEVVVITRYGRPVAAVVSADDVAELERLRSSGPAEGLGGLVGMFEDGDDLAGVLDAVVGDRSEARPLPELE